MTLRSSEGAGFGFDIFGDDSGSIAVQSLHDGGPAQQSGLIQPGQSFYTITRGPMQRGLASAPPRPS